MKTIEFNGIIKEEREIKTFSVFTFKQIILTMLILFNSIKVTLNYAYYKMDTVGFIERFCENKNKPELKCNGKCHLKNVATSQDEDKNTPKITIDFKEILFFSNTFEVFVFYKNEYIKKQNLIVYQNLYSFNNINDCFRPPEV